MRGKTHIQKTGDIRVEIMLDMTISELEAIVTALKKGKDGFYGAPMSLIEILAETQKRVEMGFNVYNEKGERDVDQ